MHSTAEEREVVMTDDGWQPPIKQPATAAHRGTATRAWCFWLFLELLGEVVTLFVCSALCLLSTVGVWCVTGARNTKKSEVEGPVGVLIFNPNGACVSVQS